MTEAVDERLSVAAMRSELDIPEDTVIEAAAFVMWRDDKRRELGSLRWVNAQTWRVSHLIADGSETTLCGKTGWGAWAERTASPVFAVCAACRALDTTEETA